MNFTRVCPIGHGTCSMLKRLHSAPDQPPAFPFVACIKRLNPPSWSLGKLSGVGGVIFAHETSISKPGAFHGEIT
jgi:hypothetical protein